MNCSLGIPNFLEEIFSLSHSLGFLYFFCIDNWGRLSYLSLLFFETLHSNGYIFPFQKWQNNLWLFPRKTIFNITGIQVYAPTRDAEDTEVEQLVILRPTRLSRTNTPKRWPFIIGDWNSKVVSQEIPGGTGKFGLGVQNEARQRLTEFCQENAPVIANILFQQHKRRLYTWTSPDGQYRSQIGYTLCSQRWRSSLQSAKTRLGAVCGLDHESLL